MLYTRLMKDLKNYEEIYEFCHRMDESLILTKGGNPTLTIMSIEVYERLFGSVDLTDANEQASER